MENCAELKGNADAFGSVGWVENGRGCLRKMGIFSPKYRILPSSQKSLYFPYITSKHRSAGRFGRSVLW